MSEDDRSPASDPVSAEGTALGGEDGHDGHDDWGGDWGDGSDGAEWERPLRIPKKALPFVGLGLVVVAAVSFVVLREGEVKGIDPQQYTDSFDRPGPPDGLGGELKWVTEGGRWSILDNTAAPVEMFFFVTFETIDVGTPDVEQAVTLRKALPGSGMVFRFQDPENYWMLRISDDAKSWQVKRMVARNEVDVKAFQGPLHDGVRVAIRTEGDTIEIEVDGHRAVTMSDSTLQGATRIGLAAATEQFAGARFDDFAFALLGQPVTPTTAAGVAPLPAPAGG